MAYYLLHNHNNEIKFERNADGSRLVFLNIGGAEKFADLLSYAFGSAVYVVELEDHANQGSKLTIVATYNHKPAGSVLGIQLLV